jgi:hypothetical protein
MGGKGVAYMKAKDVNLLTQLSKGTGRIPDLLFFNTKVELSFEILQESGA